MTCRIAALARTAVRRSVRGGTVALMALAACVASGSAGAAPAAVPLPAGVKAVWDLEHAYREATPTRERVCVNGLWRFQPAPDKAEAVPEGNWGYFKVPGDWPGITDYMHKESQAVHAHPAWKGVKLNALTAAWYQREITVPANWEGRRISLAADTVNSYAAVYVDGKTAGDLRFPAGEADLSAVLKPGKTHVLSLYVVAMPLKAVMLSYTDSASSRQVKGTVPRRGLCGDVWLVGRPNVETVDDVRVRTSVRGGEITFDAAVHGSPVGAKLRARVLRDGKEVATFTRACEPNARVALTANWKPERLWDLHTPGNVYTAEVSLLEPGGRVIDTAFPVRFGYRELWIDGRDFYLNGTRIFLSSVPFDNAQVGAAWAGYAGARQSLERLKAIGINYVYTHHYGCEPGSHLALDEVLRAADDIGMLVGVTQPHFSHYDWKAPDADAKNGYAGHAAYYAKVAGSHPSVVFYPTSHNATGYGEDMNPDLMDGVYRPTEPWSVNNAKLALRAEAIIRKQDPSRIVYHHAGGNIGAMQTINFYANFAPVQEMSDWFGHWSKVGAKPVFTCEYGVPFSWDWTMYRGWYKGQREFGSAAVPWEFCVAEWQAQFLGDKAFAISDVEKANLRWEAKQFRAGKTWHRWDYPAEVGSPRLAERYPVFATYTADNWRAFRALGVSGISPWEHGHFWVLKAGVDKGRKDLPTDWENLQRPGFSPDFLDRRYERMDLAFERSDWVPTEAAKALVRNNAPLLAYIAGPEDALTGKAHNFGEGEAVDKTIVVINNSREKVTADCDWTAWKGRQMAGQAGSKQVTLATGQQARIPIRFSAMNDGNGRCDVNLTVRFTPVDPRTAATVEVPGSFEPQTDSFRIDVASFDPGAFREGTNPTVALFDPRGQTAAKLEARNIPFTKIDAGADLSSFGTLVVGKHALVVDGPAPSLARVREGLRVLVFEQTAEVLEKRLGFRTTEYGLRRLFPRVANHPVLRNLAPEHLADWRGDSTTLPPKLKYQTLPRLGPVVKWCDIPVPHVWRCGNRGNVASALIEKPPAGDFRTILDGGYSLQYAAVMEYREGRGAVIFCQADVTGRTEGDPAAETLAGNLLLHAMGWRRVGPASEGWEAPAAAPAAGRPVVYAGEDAGRAHLKAMGVDAAAYGGGAIAPESVLVAGPGAGALLSRHERDVALFVAGGGRVLAVGLDAAEANGFLPLKIATRKAEHIATTFDPPSVTSALAGVSPADFHFREPREIPLIDAGGDGGLKVLGDGVAASSGDGRIVFCQAVPWQFGPTPQNVKRTYRRTSCALARLLCNLGVRPATPLLDRFASPVVAKAGAGAAAGATTATKPRWAEGLYLDTPEEWDDPYRFFRW